MSNGLPKFCVRVTIDVLTDVHDDAVAVREALHMISETIAADTKEPVVFTAQILTNKDHDPAPASEPPARTEASPLN